MAIIKKGTSPETESSYIVFKDGTLIKAKNGLTGNIEFIGTDAADAIKSAIEASDSSEVVITRGLYEIADNLDIEKDDFTLIINAGATLKLTNSEKYIIGIGDHTRTIKYSNITVINYGTLDANKSALVAPSADVTQCVNGCYVDNVKLLNYGIIKNSHRTNVRFEYCDFVEIRAGSIQGADVSGIDGFGDGPFYIHDGVIESCGQDGAAYFVSVHAPNSVFEKLILKTFTAGISGGMVIGNYGPGAVDHFANNNTIRNVVITEPSGIGIKTFSRDIGGGVWRGYGKNLKIEDCKITMPSTTTQRAIMNYRDNDTLIVRNCVLEYSGIYSLSKVLVLNTKIENSNLDGILVGGVSAKSIVVFCGILGTESSYPAIRLSGGRSWALFNDIIDNEGKGIWFEGLHPNYAIGNFLSDNGGVNIDGLTSDDIYYGNQGGPPNQSSGTAIIANGKSSVTVTHGLESTPTVVTLGAAHAEVTDAIWSADATNITITVPAPVTADRRISWRADIGKIGKELALADAYALADALSHS